MVMEKGGKWTLGVILLHMKQFSKSSGKSQNYSFQRKISLVQSWMKWQSITDIDPYHNHTLRYGYECDSRMNVNGFPHPWWFHKYIAVKLSMCATKWQLFDIVISMNLYGVNSLINTWLLKALIRWSIHESLRRQFNNYFMDLQGLNLLIFSALIRQLIHESLRR